MHCSGIPIFLAEWSVQAGLNHVYVQMAWYLVRDSSAYKILAARHSVSSEHKSGLNGLCCGANLSYEL